ncbi:MAG: hypothetical protein KBH94_05105 [Caldisericia bacterium]|nr:hypothetical protein [Caldisericia bacterium]
MSRIFVTNEDNQRAVCQAKSIKPLDKKRAVLYTITTDQISQAETMYNNLPKRVFQLLKEYGINDFPSLLSHKQSLQQQLNKLKPSKTIDTLESYLSFLNDSLIQNKVDYSSAQNHGLKIDLDDYPPQFLDLPIIYFYETFSSRVIKRLYEQDVYLLRDLYKKSGDNHTMYSYWKNILDTETLSYFSSSMNENVVEFSKGVQKFLEFNNITDVHTLKKDISSYEKFKKYPIGNRSIYFEIYDALTGDTFKLNEIREYINANFCGKIAILLKQINTVDRGVFLKRYFENKTLEEIGQILGLTRERVRQIESKSIFFIKPIIDLLLNFELEKYPNLKKIVESRPLLYPEEKHLLYFLDDTENSILNLLSLSSKVSIIKTGNKDYIISFRETNSIKFEDINNYIKKYKIENLKNNFSDDEITHLYYLLIAENLIIQNDIEKQFVQELLRSLLTKRFLMTIDDKKIHIKNTAISKTSLIKNILKKYGPLHFKEVKKYLYSEYGINVTDRNVNATLSREGMFVNVGRGIYDTKDSNLSGKTIIQLATDYLIKNMQPKSLHDIESYVLTRKKIKKSSIGAILLSKPNIFGRTEDGLFGLRIWNNFQYTNNTKQYRKYSVSIREAFNSLRKSGALDTPFTLNEYIERVSQTYNSETSTKRITIYTLFTQLEKEGVLININYNKRTKRWMIKN